MSGRHRRVLYVEGCEDGTVGGSHQALFDLVRQIDRLRYEPVVLFYQQNRFVDPLRALGISVIVYDAERTVERRPHVVGDRAGKLRSMLLAPVRRYRLLRENRIDLLHLNNSPAEGFDDWLPAAFLARIPSVAHGMGRYRPPSRPLQRWLTRQHDRVIAISEYVRGTMTMHGMPNDRIRVIPLGVDIAEFTLRARRDPASVRCELGVGPNRLLVIMVGNIRHWKGQDVVLDALIALPPQVRACLRVAFAGATAPADAPFEAELRATVARGGLQDVVTFLGGRNDVPDLVNASDIVVHASRVPEPFGLVVVEGMALGKPVMATHFGGPAEILTRQSGRTYDPEKPSELAALLQTLVENEALRTALGTGARERARAFDAQHVTRAIERVYDEIL